MKISVLDPIVDLMMAHGLIFSYYIVDDLHSWYWIRCCFMWLTSFKDIYIDLCTTVLDEKILSKKWSNKVTNRDILHIIFTKHWSTGIQFKQTDCNTNWSKLFDHVYLLRLLQGQVFLWISRETTVPRTLHWHFVHISSRAQNFMLLSSHKS